VHGEDVLDETAHIPFDRRQPQGQVRWRVQGDGGQRGRFAPVAAQGQRAEQALRPATAAAATATTATAAGPTGATAAAAKRRRRRRWPKWGQKARRRPEQVQLPAETVQPRSEGARHQGPGVPGTVTRVL